jgi:hypothetical protein
VVLEEKASTKSENKLSGIEIDFISGIICASVIGRSSTKAQRIRRQVADHPVFNAAAQLSLALERADHVAA